MTIDNLLCEGNIERLDAEILLSFILSIDRAQILTFPDKEVSEEKSRMYRKTVKRRKSGEPIAYITQEKEFYARSFHVNPSVLIPRPSTEGLIDLFCAFVMSGKEENVSLDSGISGLSLRLGDANNLAWDTVPTIVDVGTGSGCIAVTLAHRFPQNNIVGIDVSTDALSVAQINATKHDVSDRISFVEGNLLTPLNDCTDPYIVVSNPPYVPSVMTLSKDVENFEPTDALFAGEMGMDVIASLLSQAYLHPLCRGIVIECREDQVPLIFRTLDRVKREAIVVP